MSLDLATCSTPAAYSEESISSHTAPSPASTDKNACRESAPFSSWVAAMKEGQFELGWAINNRHAQHWPSAHVLFKGSLRKLSCIKILSLHGLGDAIQMLRYVPMLHTMAMGIVYEVPETLRPLLPFFRGVEQGASQQVDSVGHTSNFPVVEIMELPHLFKTSLRQLPIATHYLTLPRKIVLPMQKVMGRGSKKRVGVIWAGGAWDQGRWIPIEFMASLFNDKRFEWWNLQGGIHAREAAGMALNTKGVIQQEGVLTLAASIANLDLLLTIDSLAAHLGGAMGTRTWVLLKHDADWRWMRERRDTPWYPSARLFRQPSRGDWESVIRSVHAELDNI